MATVIGAGVQGREHLQLLPLIRELNHINVCSLRVEDAQKLAAHSDIARPADDVAAAVRESDIVCLATHSPVPVIEPEWIKPGRTSRPWATIRRAASCLRRWHARIASSSRHSTRSSQRWPDVASSLAWTPPLEQPWAPWFSAGRRAASANAKITVYKAMGIAMEDMVAANLAYQRARRDNSGGVMVW